MVVIATLTRTVRQITKETPVPHK